MQKLGSGSLGVKLAGPLDLFSKKRVEKGKFWRLWTAAGGAVVDLSLTVPFEEKPESIVPDRHEPIIAQRYHFIDRPFAALICKPVSGDADLAIAVRTGVFFELSKRQFDRMALDLERLQRPSEVITGFCRPDPVRALVKIYKGASRIRGQPAAVPAASCRSYWTSGVRMNYTLIVSPLAGESLSAKNL